MPSESRAGNTIGLLRVLAAHAYPTILSTKGTLFAAEGYASLLDGMDSIVQISLSALDTQLAKALEGNTPSPKERLSAASTLSSTPVTVRIQPAFPGLEEETLRVIDAAAEAGARHVAVEHLKLPFYGRRQILDVVNEATGVNLGQYYQNRRCVGTEYVLDSSYVVEAQLRFAERAHSLGLSYSPADNELLPFAQSDCCCSGADQILRSTAYFRHNFTHAVRSAIRRGDNVVRYRHMEEHWAPAGSINRFLNSRSRVPGVANVKSYLRTLWNSDVRTNRPSGFFGVRDTGRRDERGDLLYTIDSRVADLLASLHE